MSKASTASAKTPAQLPSQSAWAKGPPSNSNSLAPSPRSQSPAPSHAPSPISISHSRRPSALGQGVPLKDSGVSVPRSNVGSVRQGSSAVTFGSIDDASSSLSSSPAAAPVVKTENVKTFGTVPAAPSTHVNGKPAVATVGSSKLHARPPSSSISSSSNMMSSSATPATPLSTTSAPTKLARADITKLFQGSSVSSQSSSDTSSPSTRSSNLPQHHQPSSGQHPPQPPTQPSQLGTHQFAPYVPGIRPQQGVGGPRSPAFPRAVPNGTGAPPRPLAGPGGPGGPPIPASPRLAPHPPHPHQPPPAGVPAQQVPMQSMGWAPYYYPVDAYGQPAPWFYPPLHQQPHPPHTPHAPAPATQGPPHPSMPLSPRNPPPSLPPGTPTVAHAVPHPPHTPQPPSALTHQPSNNMNISSPPPTPSTTTAAPSVRSLNTNASTFVPTSRPHKPVVIKNEDGMEVNLETLKKHSPQPPTVPIPPPSPVTTSRRTASVRIESEESKRKREEQARLEQEKKDAEEHARKEGEERKRKEEEEAKRKEEEAQRKEEEERREQERVRKEEEEKERLRLEEEERKRRDEEARLEEERSKTEKEKEQKERAEREAEERRQQEAMKDDEVPVDAEEAREAVESPSEESKEPEDGEVVENGEIVEPQVNGDFTSKPPRAAKEPLRIDTSSMPPPLEIPRRRPGPLDINAARRDMSAAPLSALVTARNIERLQDIEYPEGVRSPREDLNKDAKDGKFRYDRDFLMQFMQVCREKPPNLPPLDILGIEPVDQSTFSMTRGGSGRHRQPSSAMPTNRQNSVGLGISAGFNAKPGAAPGPFPMGQFSTPTSKLTSEERYMMASGTRSASVSGGSAAIPFNRTAMTRTASQGGPGGHPMGSNRVRSKRGDKRTDANKVTFSQQGPPDGLGFGAPGAAPLLGSVFEPVAPLEMSANRWVASSIIRKPVIAEADSPELVDRKVRALLNKLTMEKFDSISDQIITFANKSENEKDGRTLIQVIRLVFEKATDEAAWSEMYARLCRKMMETISPEVQDDGIRNAEGKPIAGGQLFRKYLLNRCQEDFERGWFAKETTAAAAAAKASDDQAIKAANEKKGDESELYSDEYYAAQKAKRQGLGLIKFIGELFKLQMLTERIMHECVKKLLGNVENPEEEEIESLCQLLKTVGQLLDVPKARAHMDVYFTRMKELGKSTNVSARMQFMLQDVIELRDRKWVARGAIIAPTTISAVHEAAAKEKAAAEAQTYQRQLSMSRNTSRRGHERNVESGPDGWTTTVGSVTRSQPKAGDLSQFGKISKGAPMVMGPSSVFTTKKDNKRDSLSRTSSSSNMFSMLSQNPELAVDTTAKPSRPPSRKPSVDLGQGGVPEPPQRKKLQLLPRSIPTPAEETPPPEDEPESLPPMSEADAKKKIDEDVKEFFAVRSMEEADIYFTNLPEEHRFHLVDKLVGSALESKEADAVLVAEFFARAASKGQCSPEVFEAGFMPMAELLDDIAIDAPNAFKFMAIMLKGAGYDRDEEGLARLTGKSMDSDKLLELVTS